MNQFSPSLISGAYRGELVDQILAMPRKTGITFEKAVALSTEEKLRAALLQRLGRGPGEYFWFDENFVTYISSRGFHIELTGDEMLPASYWDC